MSKPITSCALSLVLGMTAAPQLGAQGCPPPSIPSPKLPGPSTPESAAPAPRSSQAPARGPVGPTSGARGRACAPAPITGQAPLISGVSLATTSIGAALPTPPAAWKEWWRFNGDAFLDVRGHVRRPAVRTGDDSFFLGHGARREGSDGAAPTEAQVREQVLPHLVQTLEQERDPFVLAQALVAAASTARSLDVGAKREVEPLLRAHMGHANIYVSELALLAYGLLSLDSAAPSLAGVVCDTSAGRQLVGARSALSTRARAYAAYGLGLLAEASDSEDVRRYATHALVNCLRESRIPVDVEVACISALGLAGLTAAGDGTVLDSPDSVTASRTAQLGFLLELAEDRNRERRVRSHALTAIARLVHELPAERHGEVKAEIGPRLVDLLRMKGRNSNELVQACTLAIASLGDADGDALDVSIRRRLEHLIAGGGDQVTRGFALMALAEVAADRGTGSEPGAAREDVADLLLRQLARGKSFARPWAGLALGVLGHRMADDGVAVPLEWQTSLRDALDGAATADETAAYCVALGLVRDSAAVGLIRDAFGRGDDVRRYAAIGLGLAGARGEIERIEHALLNSGARPDDLRDFSKALALLGDARGGELLLSLIADGPFATRVAAARALGQLGDARAVAPLVELMADDRRSDAVRAEAAGALGRVVESSDLPWSTSYAVSANFRAATETLYDLGGGGVLNLH